MSITVEFNFSVNTFDLTVTAVVTPGLKSSRGSFDRFQEPDDDDEVEIISIVDESGGEYPFGMFNNKTKKEIEALAIEAAAKESEPEYED